VIRRKTRTGRRRRRKRRGESYCQMQKTEKIPKKGTSWRTEYKDAEGSSQMKQLRTQ
jgi:hypothetical protein